MANRFGEPIRVQSPVGAFRTALLTGVEIGFYWDLWFDLWGDLWSISSLRSHVEGALDGRLNVKKEGNS